MKSRFLTILVFALACTPFAHAQSTAEDVYTKVAKIDMLSNLNPLFLTKSQLDALLPVVEKCRARVKKANADVDTVFLQIAGVADDTYKKCVADGSMPGDEARKKFVVAIRAAGIIRKAAADENVDNAYAVFAKVLQPNQRKIAANTVPIEYYDPSAKVATMKQEDKEREFVRFILLDPVSYDVMLDLWKAAKN